MQKFQENATEGNVQFSRNLRSKQTDVTNNTNVLRKGWLCLKVAMPFGNLTIYECCNAKEQKRNKQTKATIFTCWSATTSLDVVFILF